ncbi:helix-turn-helix transcriptional regulator [Tenacibaculum sp. ZS6-P6]|uniref:helix-turn-helix transcriptional regulator n=1 Tax=Tenacibaculum sp. ZS6-P6 TaxID=3447503 RepID=UPI003F9847BB
MKIKSYIPEEPYKCIYKEFYDIIIEENKEREYIPLIDDCCYDMVFFKEQKGQFIYGKDQKRIPLEAKVFTIHNLNIPPYKLQINKKLSFVTIKFQPWVNSYFFSDLNTNGIVSLSEDNRELELFHQTIFEEKNIKERLNLIYNYIDKKEVMFTEKMKFVKSICEHIYKRNGKVSVNDLCSHYNKTRQYLNRIFKSEVLYTLKSFIITVRILDLVKFKLKNSEITLTQLSYEYGYFDQSHFIRDFKKVCGVTPRKFFENPSEFMLRHK